MLTGGLVGNSIDQQQRERLRQQAPQTYARVDQGQPLSLADVKALAQSGVSDYIIISQIRTSDTVYHLTAADIIDLRNAGVSNAVIDFMINTPNTVGFGAFCVPGNHRGRRTNRRRSPPVETIVVAPGPGYVWIGGEWLWNGRWVWVTGHWGYPPHPHAVWVGGHWLRGSDGAGIGRPGTGGDHRRRPDFAIFELSRSVGAGSTRRRSISRFFFQEKMAFASGRSAPDMLKTLPLDSGGGPLHYGAPKTNGPLEDATA